MSHGGKRWLLRALGAIVGLTLGWLAAAWLA